MIKFFRKIRQKTLTENKFGKYLTYAIGEIILVVIGILIALAINNWNENRKLKAQELASMQEIVENLEYDIVRCENNISKNLIIIQGLDSLKTSVSNTIDEKDETINIYYYTLKYSLDYNKAVLNKSAYDELMTSTLTKSIDNRKLISSLSDYYERIATTITEFRPKNGHINLQTTRKKFISLKGLETFVQSFDSINTNNFTVDYNFDKIKKMEHLKLLKPEGLELIDYYNEITQFQIDLKTYIFYMSWIKKSAKNLILEIESEYQIE
jgi:hypothetical protein